MPHSLAAVTCHFNPCGYRRPRENYFHFREALRGCPLFTVEVSFDGIFHLPAEWQILATERQLMWQKEQLLNWAIAHMPGEFDQIAWIDADLLFLNPCWAEETSRLLEDYPVVQLFENCHWTTSHGTIDRSGPSLLRQRRERLRQHGQPGGAWAARRDVLAKHGLYAGNIIGGGDTLFGDALFGVNSAYVARSLPRQLLADVRRWGRALYRDVEGRVGCTPGDVVHLYHGTRENRRYVERAAILRENSFNPTRDIRTADNGLLEWATDKPDLHRRVRDYFLSRREDS
jgi:hypothetical protein